MIKKLTKILICVCVLVITCMFFPAKFSAVEAATIENVSGNQIPLTGQVNTNQPHFFKDENGVSTLVNADVLNNNDERYAITSKLSGSESSGWGDFAPTPDMIPFIQNGLLYAAVSANITSTNNTSVTLSVSLGDQTQSATIQNGELTTPLLKIDDASFTIKYSFSASSDTITDFIINKPILHLYTKIEHVVLNMENQNVMPGQLVKVDAYNEVTQLKMTSETSGNFMSVAKINHAIKFNFIEGGEYVSIIDNYLLISKDAPTDKNIKIKFNVYSNANMYSSDIIPSDNTVELTIADGRVNVEVQTDFENPAVIEGEGLYDVGDNAVLTVRPNSDFTFDGWYIIDESNPEGKFVSKRSMQQFSIKPDLIIKAKFTKSISLSNIFISKVYDGTTDIAAENVQVEFLGKENNHDLTLSNMFTFEGKDAGTNKPVTIDGELVLAGGDVDKYKLKSTIAPSNIIGEIKKRDVEIYAYDTQKEYGYFDTTIQYETPTNLVAGEKLVGSPSREPGENLGQYNITLGDLAQRNPNYNPILKSDTHFTIVARTLSLENVSVVEKVYDGCTTAEVNAQLRNIYNNEDVKVKIYADFSSKNAGDDIQVNISKLELYGANKDNYVIGNYTQAIYGKIDKRPTEIIAHECSFTYGEKISLTYDVTNLVDGDKFDGQLDIDGTSVGFYQIKNNLSNNNYIITNYIAANCTIEQRKVIVRAISQTKFYGDEDPALTYETENLVDGDEFTGALVREDSENENVGEYVISQGDLKNDNYIIEYHPGILKIEPRNIVAEIQFLDKTYDGNLNVEYSVNFKDNVKNDTFVLDVIAQLASADCGVVDVQITSINCDHSQNYIVSPDVKNLSIEILKRNAYVYIKNVTKTYGDANEDFVYDINNLVENQTLDLTLSREPGEDVDSYEIFAETTNDNYKVVLTDNYFEITPKIINVSIKTLSKVFGDEEKPIEFKLLDDFCYDDTYEEIITGSITRQPGEYYGFYEFDVSSLSTSKNYTFVNVNNANFSILRKQVVVTCNDATKIYGEEDPIFTYSVSSKVEGEELILTITYGYNQDVGEYTLTCDKLVDARYEIVEVINGTFKITPAKISIKADDKVKVYGDADPKLSVSITKGFLKNGDQLDKISQGSLTRENNENVGEYVISKGDFNLGKNYEVEFIENQGKLTIIPRNIIVTAKAQSKVYGDADPELDYEFLEGELKFGDVLTGALIRESNENVGEYVISQGTLVASDNYNLTFINGKFTILKRQIEVIPTTLEKQYGEEDTEIEYVINGTMIGDDELTGHLYRAKDKNEIEQTGKYKIYSDLENPNYEIVFKEYFFTIAPREIVVKAQSYQINYGEQDPEMEYSVLSGEILPGDSIHGSLSRVQGSSVGEYEIISMLDINRNYSINFISGTLTIKPAKLTIQSENYTKVYGDEDPMFDYKIIEGELINNDILYGTISRKAGEDVGTYSLIKGVYNANYDITMLPANLEITTKYVKLKTGVYNKVYDGTPRAYLKNPYVSGLPDDISLSYNKEDCAQFVSYQVGNNIPVKIYNISLIGEKANNYSLILPDNLYADITYDAIINDDVCVTTQDAVLHENYTLNVDFEHVKSNLKIQNHKLVLKYNIWIDGQGDQISTDSSYTIKIKLPTNIYEKNNIYVYHKLDDGKLLRLSSSKTENGELAVDSNVLGEFYITIEDETWLDYATIASLNIFAIIIIGVCISVVCKYRKKQKNK